jgi:hypothetical protein
MHHRIKSSSNNRLVNCVEHAGDVKFIEDSEQQMHLTFTTALTVKSNLTFCFSVKN